MQLNEPRPSRNGKEERSQAGAAQQPTINKAFQKANGKIKIRQNRTGRKTNRRLRELEHLLAERKNIGVLVGKLLANGAGTGAILVHLLDPLTVIAFGVLLDLLDELGNLLAGDLALNGRRKKRRENVV